MGLLDQLGGMAAGQGGGRAGEVGAFMQMMQSQPGGIDGVLSSFRQKGFGGVAQS